MYFKYLVPQLELTVLYNRIDLLALGAHVSSSSCWVPSSSCFSGFYAPGKNLSFTPLAVSDPQRWFANDSIGEIEASAERSELTTSNSGGQAGQSALNLDPPPQVSSMILAFLPNFWICYFENTFTDNSMGIHPF